MWVSNPLRAHGGVTDISQQVAPTCQVWWDFTGGLRETLYTAELQAPRKACLEANPSCMALGIWQLCHSLTLLLHSFKVGLQHCSLPGVAAGQFAPDCMMT